MRHEFTPTIYYNAFGPYDPVFEIDDGDTLVSNSLCARGMDANGRKVAERGNPLTGPIFVKGASPGDTLAVHIDHVWPNRPQGWTRTIVASHVVDPSYVKALPNDQAEPAVWEMDLEGGTATLDSPATGLGEITLDLDPMLGCLGVAPSRKQAISSATSAQHGGNMDYRGLRTGATIYFPIFEEGALLFFGDGHAVQGDGEIIGTGIEISFDVQLTVQVLKGKTIEWPRGECESHILTIGNARPLDQGLQHATSEMMRWLQEDYGLDPHGASILLGQCVEYDVGNVFDPAYTMVCKVPKVILAKLPPR